MFPTFCFSIFFPLFPKRLCYYMTLDTQNLRRLSVLEIIHPLIHRKECEEDKSSLNETLSRLESFSIGNLQCPDSHGQWKGVER